MNYYKSKNLLQNIAALNRAILELEQPALIIATLAPLVMIGARMDYDLFNPTSGATLNRVHFDMDVCGGPDWFDSESIVTGLFMPATGVHDPDAWIQRTLENLGIAFSMENGELMSGGKKFGSSGSNNDHSGWIFHGARIATSINYDLAETAANYGRNLRQTFSGLNQLKYDVTVDQVIIALENNFQPCFREHLNPVAISTIQKRVDELNVVFTSESWLKHGKLNDE